MKDFPVFTTENGVASITLKEVPYTGKAYIRIQSTASFDGLLRDCVDFCKAVGAEHFYAAGHENLERFPLHTAVWRLEVQRETVGDSEACLFPVTEQTLEKWRSIYNEKMAPVPAASWMTAADGKEMLRKGDGYFIHREGTLLGIGRASGDFLCAIAAVERGAGEQVVKALCSADDTETVHLNVASENHRALGLYTRLGFIRTAEVVRWYDVKNIF